MLSGGRVLETPGSLSEAFEFDPVPSSELREGLRGLVGRLGFRVTLDLPFVTSASRRWEVKGYLYAERAVMKDSRQTWRRNRVRLAILAVTIPLAAWRNWAVSVDPHNTWLARVGTIAAVGGSVPAFIFAEALAQRDYWSDVIGIVYHAPFTPANDQPGGLDRPLAYTATITIGRAFSQDNVLGYGSYRNVLALFPDPGLDSVRDALTAQLSGDEPTAPDARLS